MHQFLARDAFVRTYSRAIAMMFVLLSVRLSVHLSVRLGRACIVIIRYTLVRTSVYGCVCVERQHFKNKSSATAELARDADAVDTSLDYPTINFNRR